MDPDQLSRQAGLKISNIQFGDNCLVRGDNSNVLSQAFHVNYIVKIDPCHRPVGWYKNVIWQGDFLA